MLGFLPKSARPPLAMGCLLLLGSWFAPAPLAAQEAPAAKPAPQYRYWTTEWSFEAIDVGQLNRRLRAIGIDTGLQIRGEVSVNFRVSVPWNAPRTVEAYKLSGQLTSPGIQIDNLQLGATRTAVQLRQGVLSVRELRSEVGEGRLSGSASLALDAARTLTLDVVGDDLPMASMTSIFSGVATNAAATPLVDGTIDVVAAGKAQLNQQTFDLRGRLASPNLSVNGVQLGLIEHAFEVTEKQLRWRPLADPETQLPGTMRLVSIAADYQLEPQAFSLTNLDAQVWGGAVTGQATFAREPTALHEVDLQLAGVRPQFRQVPWSNQPAAFAATVSGDVTWQVPAESLGIPSEHQGQATLSLQQIRLGQENVGRIETEIAIDAGQVQLAASGDLFGGRLDVKTLAQAEADKPFNEARWQWSIERFRLAGRLGTAQAAGGLVWVPAEGAFPRAEPGVTVDLNRVPLARLFPTLGLTWGTWWTGTASGHVTIAGRSAYRARGTLRIDDMHLSQLDLGRVQSTVGVRFAPAARDWQVDLRNIATQIGYGRLHGDAKLRRSRGRSRGFDLESKWRARDVDFVDLAQQLGSSSRWAQGRMTGRAQVDGKSIRSVQDLTGNFDMRLGPTNGAALPGLVSVQRYLGPIQLASTKFENGRARGLIGGGAIALQEFTLVSDAARLHADGRIGISDGRLQLAAMIATGNFNDASVDLVRLAQRYALQAVIPATIFADVISLISDRAIVFNVFGSLSSPQVRIRPIETFREEAALFLLREVYRLTVAGVADSVYEGVE